MRRRSAARRLSILSLSTLLVGGLAATPASSAAPSGGDAQATGAVQVTRDDSGRVRTVRPSAGRSVKAPAVAGRAPATPEAAARGHLRQYGNLFGVRDSDRDLAVTGTEALGGANTVRFQQRIGGLPVIGGELVATVDRNGDLQALNGETSTGSVDATPKVTAAKASATALAATAALTKAPAKSLRAGKPELAAYDPALLGASDIRGVRAVWRISVHGTADDSINQLVLVNADDGRVALTFSETEYFDGGARKVCDYQNDPAVPWAQVACPGAYPVARGEGDAPTGVANVDNVYDMLGGYRDFLTSLGRNSIDGAGMELKASVRVCSTSSVGCPTGSYHWSGTEMIVGGQCTVGDDVMSHEFTHGLIERGSRLLYTHQSGSIAESLSDVLGEAFDQLYSGPAGGGDTAAERWLLAEDPGSCGRGENMADPTANHRPDSTDSPLWKYYLGGGFSVADYNAGVGNKAAYLMTDGGTFGGFTIKPIGDIRKVAAIWLGAERLLTSGADYVDLAYALHQSCATLSKDAALGITADNCLSVLYATGAVKMSTPPAKEGQIPQAPRCAAPAAANTLVHEDFSGNAGTLPPGWEGSGEARLDDSAQPSTSAGKALYIPEIFGAPWAATKTADTTFVTQLPASGPIYASFDHRYALPHTWYSKSGFEGWVYWTGGRFEIDVIGDEAGFFAPAGAWDVGPDKHSAGLPGSPAFGGDSWGWTSSRVDLTAYAGLNIKLRFKLGSYEEYFEGHGWWIDNVRLYTCSGKRPLTNDINGDGYGDVAIGEPGRTVTGHAGAGDVRVVLGGSAGLNPQGDELYSQDNSLVAGASTANGGFGTAVATADYNADGFADVAVGAPGSPDGRGSLTTLRGHAWGLTAQQSAAVSAPAVIPATGNDAFGAAVAAGDFNGDGFADAAVGAPGYAYGKGGVKVLYGSVNGLVNTGTTVNWLTQDTGAVPDTGEYDDRFGATLAAGDFNGDGRTDLAVGAPGEDVGTIADTGAVTILLGSATGLTATGSQWFHQDVTDVPDNAEAGDAFGLALSAGDVTQDGKADLVVGAPSEDVGATANAGAVFVLRGASGGLTAAGSQVLDQDSPVVPDSAEAGDRFGASVAVGDLNGDGFADVAVGAPNEAVDTVANAGAVTTLPGSASGLVTAGSLWSQGSGGVDDAAEQGDQFGVTLILTKLGKTAKADLIVGVPFENGTAYNDQGAIHVLNGTATGNQLFTTDGLIGGGTAAARFGGALA
ncbi:M4 family metallopeptidase [Catellatospora sp. NPDC049609]|uniref:M4 family metallopeptidase n=1 Tax=Catellatospora sp. NPDC049609 TaxID=3155505 RepID=UPI00344A6ECF